MRKLEISTPDVATMRASWVSFLAAIVAAFLPSVLFAATLRTGEVDVVFAKNAPGPVQLAAEEMTNFLSRVLGCPVPVMNRLDPSRTSIILGTNDWSVAAGVDVTKLPTDGFLCRMRENRIFIAGADDSLSYRQTVRLNTFRRGTLNGVYGFLEKYANCRFYFPGELGEIVPPCLSLEIPEGDWADAPKMIARSHSYHSAGRWFDETRGKEHGADMKRLAVWRLRMESQKHIMCHGLRFFRYGHRFIKSHPEYFMLQKDGTRYLHDTEKSPYHRNCKLCFSSGVREEIYQDVKALLTGQPPASRGLDRWPRAYAQWGNYVGVQPEDGWCPCQCGKCKAAYRTDDPKSFASELVWGLTKEIAERLAAEGIDAVLMQSAYGAWTDVPRFDLPKNLSIDIATFGGWGIRNEAYMKSQEERISKWAKKLGYGVFNWTYHGKFSCLQLDIPDIPQVTPRAIGAYYKRMAPYLAGTYCETYTDRWFFDMLNVYVLSRVLWDPSADVDAILDEHYRLMYGKGAGPMKGLFDALEDKWLDEICGNVQWTSVGPKVLTPSEFRIWTDIYSPASVAKLLELSDAAAAAVVPGSVEARRIALVRREILERLDRHARDYSRALSVENEKADRAVRRPKNLVEGFEPVEIAVDGTMTNRPFKAVKYAVPFCPGHRYRISCFVKGENVRPFASRGGVQGVAWQSEKDDNGVAFPNVGAEGTFDWVHFSKEVRIGEKPPESFRPEVDLRLFQATGKAWFDGLLVEEVK